MRFAVMPHDRGRLSIAEGRSRTALRRKSMESASRSASAGGERSQRQASPSVIQVLLEIGALAILSGILFFFHLGTYGLWEPDEARYAEIAREMLATHHFTIPHLNFVPYLEKPP